jgi:hypothetical protein
MSQAVNLKELERKAWTSYFQDGLWDIFLGLLLVSSAVSTWLSDSGVPSSTRIPTYIGIMVLGGLVLWAGKRFITVPRLGRVKFGPKRKAKLNWVRVVLFISVLVIWVLFLAGLGISNDWLQAYFMDFKRLYLYGLLLALQEVVGVGLRELADVDIGFFIGSAVSAVIVLLIGTVVLVRFLRDYPLLGVEASNGNT